MIKLFTCTFWKVYILVTTSTHIHSNKHTLFFTFFISVVLILCFLPLWISVFCVSTSLGNQTYLVNMYSLVRQKKFSGKSFIQVPLKIWNTSNFYKLAETVVTESLIEKQLWSKFTGKLVSVELMKTGWNDKNLICFIDIFWFWSNFNYVFHPFMSVELERYLTAHWEIFRNRNCILFFSWISHRRTQKFQNWKIKVLRPPIMS